MSKVWLFVHVLTWSLKSFQIILNVSGASHTVNILKVEMLLPASATDSSSVSQGQYEHTL